MGCACSLLYCSHAFLLLGISIGSNCPLKSNMFRIRLIRCMHCLTKAMVAQITPLDLFDQWMRTPTEPALHTPLLNAAHSLLPGKAIKGKREQYTIATKCGIIIEGGGMKFDGSRKHVREACEGSLRRLGIDTIDLYYLHR